MIYEYDCTECELSVEKIRKMSEREDPVACECGANMLPVITGGAGFKITGGGVASAGSKAYEKNKDEKSSSYYGPGQNAWLAQDTVRRDEHNTKKERHGL